MKARWLTILVAAALSGGGHTVAAESDAVIELPPMIVSESTWTKPWRYATGAGMEVLSHCDDSATRALIERTDRLNQLLGYILPPELEFHPAAPRLTILVDAAMAPSLSQNLVTTFGRRPQGERPDLLKGPTTRAPSAPRVSMLPNLQLNDVDLMAVFAIVDERNFDADGVAYAPEYVLHLLEHRTPPLPPWFVVGFMRSLRELSFGSSEMRIAPFTWTTFAEQQELKDDPDAVRELMPMSDFFARRFQGAGSIAEQRLWRAQAGLFIRWALDPAEPQRRLALWRFVAAAAKQGESEALLLQCFQLGYSDLRDRLSDYLPVALAAPIVVEPPKLVHAPRVRLRDATPAEVARIKGEWERLEVGFVRRRHAAFAPQYAAVARQTLTAGLQQAPNDPGILTARGLLESDLDDPQAARPYLEAAVTAGAVRPRVYVELAKFRLADALAAPDSGPLSVGKAEVVLEPLQRALAEQPPLEEVYALAAEVWARSRAILNPAQWRLLTEGIRRFPTNPRLLAYSAELKATNGDFTTALSWVERAIALSRASPATEATLLQLHDSLVQAEKEHVAPGTGSHAPASSRPADR